MVNHFQLTKKTKMNVYFCDSKSPWQRGSNENTHGLLRQYFPRKTPLGHFQQEDLNDVAGELNNSPIKILDYRTPEEILFKVLQPTVESTVTVIGIHHSLNRISYIVCSPGKSLQ